MKPRVQKLHMARDAAVVQCVCIVNSRQFLAVCILVLQLENMKKRPSSAPAAPKAFKKTKAPREVDGESFFYWNDSKQGKSSQTRGVWVPSARLEVLIGPKDAHTALEEG